MENLFNALAGEKFYVVRFMDNLYASRTQGYFCFLDVLTTALYQDPQRAKITCNTIKVVGLQDKELSEREAESVQIIEVAVDPTEKYGLRVIGPYLEH